MLATSVGFATAIISLGPVLAAGSAINAASRALIVGRDTPLLSTYDYVIVGAGAAGLTVADRLTEDSDATVLVIEAGNFDQGEDEILVPFYAIQAPSKYFYNIQSTPMPELNNRTQVLQSGKLVGGGTAVNGMFMPRGAKGDYDIWEELGNPGWNWDNLLPYFIKSETFTPPPAEVAQEFEITYDMEYHGTTGPVQSSYPPFLYPAVKLFLDAIRQFGSHVPYDYASGDALGGYWAPNTLDPHNETRSYARPTHYEPVKLRSNLHLLANNTVIQIVFDGATATGVKFATAREEQVQTASASKEVIIAAGAPHTPQLLQLSGIGSEALLKSYNISIISDLPGVGANFHDHPFFPTSATVAHDLNPSPANNSNTTWLAGQWELYKEKRQGVYTASLGNAAAFLPLNEITNTSSTVVSKLQSQNPQDVFPAGTDPSVIAGWEAERDLIIKYTEEGKIAAGEFIGGPTVAMYLVLVKPFSRGSININTTDPFADPVVDFGTLRNPLDLDILVEMIRAWREMLLTPALQTMGPTATNPPDNMTSTADLQDFVRANLQSSLWHPTGTAAMMKKELGGVVGPDLLVYGTKKLSIIDASILPILPSTHITSTMYAVAEKAADIIKVRNS